MRLSSMISASLDERHPGDFHGRQPERLASASLSTARTGA
jgi:hypothetical protein